MAPDGAGILTQAACFIFRTFSPQYAGGSVVYSVLLFLLVVGFTYFYTMVIFNQQNIPDQLQRNGGFIPGIRPGKRTEEYLSRIIYRITLVGALAANILGRSLINLWDRLINRTPIVRSIYKSSKQIFETIFSEQGASFRQVCLVEWPRKDCWSIGFVSREVDGEELGLVKGRAMYAVYVSTTPNPTSGYVFFVDQNSVKILSMSVEDGLKLVISMGLIFPDKPLLPEEELKVARTAKRPSRKTKA